MVEPQQPAVLSQRISIASLWITMDNWITLNRFWGIGFPTQNQQVEVTLHVQHVAFDPRWVQVPPELQ